MSEDMITKPVNPLLNRIKIPGETIRLPSNGIFYTDGELSPEVSNGEIHIYPLTTMSEILLRSPDKLLNGDALNDIMQQCAPQIIKPMNLLSKDVDYLMTALRKVTYGDLMDINYTHNCKDAKEHTYSINLNTILAQTRPIDPTTLNETFSIKMSNDQIVKLHPMRFSNVVEIMQSVNSYDVNEKVIGTQLIKSVACMISSVDEIEDSELIFEWLTNIPTSWFNDISKALEKVSDWGTDFKYISKCKDCGKEVELSVSLNPLTFFM